VGGYVCSPAGRGVRKSGALRRLSTARELRLQPVVHPIESFLLHLQAEDVRLVVESSSEHRGGAGLGVNRGEFVNGFLHSLQWIELILTALQDHQGFGNHASEEIRQIEKVCEAGKEMDVAVSLNVLLDHGPQC